MEAIKYFLNSYKYNSAPHNISVRNLYIETGRHKRPSKVTVNQRFYDKCKSTEDAKSVQKTLNKIFFLNKYIDNQTFIE